MLSIIRFKNLTLNNKVIYKISIKIDFSKIRKIKIIIRILIININKIIIIEKIKIIIIIEKIKIIIKIIKK